MSTNTSTAVSVPGLEGVAVIAAEYGADAHLSTLLEMTRQVFPTVRLLGVQVEDDLDIEDDWRIVFVVEAPLSVAQAVDGVRQWYRRLFECCPPAHACLFRLAIRVVK